MPPSFHDDILKYCWHILTFILWSYSSENMAGNRNYLFVCIAQEPSGLYFGTVSIFYLFIYKLMGNMASYITSNYSDPKNII